jgi:hypothetical protein
MRSLKAAMRWDEERYGREYDLDVFNIVAVSHFNMGAMENKGLNVFNAKYILARPDTATDADFAGIEGVVAHEYFHNWTGNRITCRDWFQLSLKEGFTVYRDQEFSRRHGLARGQAHRGRAHAARAPVPGGRGPMAHPVRPDSYIEINNFYTATVYEKGAEVVRMQANLLGPERFRAGTDLYFERFDGQAVTTDDFVACMEQAGGLDLDQFRRWYARPARRCWSAPTTSTPTPAPTGWRSASTPRRRRASRTSCRCTSRCARAAGRRGSTCRCNSPARPSARARHPHAGAARAVERFELRRARAARCRRCCAASRRRCRCAIPTPRTS